MNKKYLISVVVFVIISICSLLASLWYVNEQRDLNMRGKYTFSQTRENIQNLANIKITSPNNGEINIYHSNGVWRFKEAGDYFISSDMLAQFFNMINNSVIISVNKGNADEYEKKSLVSYHSKDNAENIKGVEVETFDENGKLLDDVIVGAYDGDEKLRFAKSNNSSAIWSISEVNGFSGDAAGWIPSPLLKIDEMVIDDIVIDGKYINRELLDEILPHSAKLRNILKALRYVNYNGIIKKTDFEAENAKLAPKANQIKIITNVGLVYVFNVYYVNEVYWLSIELAHTKIPYKEVPEFVAQNQKYFADWLFILDNEQGEIFYEKNLF